MYSKEDFPVSQKHKHHRRLDCIWYLGKGKSCGDLLCCLGFFNVPYQNYFLKTNMKTIR